MARNPRKKYRPDYGKLYPGVGIDPDVMTVLKKSDRKMEYQECDIKYPRIKKDKAGNVVGVLPPCEDSYDEHLEFNQQFEDDSVNTEQDAVDRILAQKLHNALAMLTDEEREIIYAIFFEHIALTEYAGQMGITKQSLFERKQRILAKLKKCFDFLP